MQKRQCISAVIHSNGEVDERQQENDEALGTYIHEDEATYTGQWEHDLQHGKGIKNGQMKVQKSYFEGFYKYGRRMDQVNLYGLMELYMKMENIPWPVKINIIKDIGKQKKWKRRIQMDDQCYLCVWPDGKIYEGDNLNDQKHCQGILKFPDGKIYEGEWQNDRKALLKLPNGQISYGQWKNDIRIN